MRNIDENASDDVIRILVGNKSDLHHCLVVSSQEGKLLADKFRVDFFETSAKSDTSPNVPKMFQSLTEKILDQKQQSITDHQSVNVKLSNNQTDSTYGKFIGCCSSTKTLEK
jgi:GTPase SAR1 family protein